MEILVGFNLIHWGFFYAKMLWLNTEPKIDTIIPIIAIILEEKTRL